MTAIDWLSTPLVIEEVDLAAAEILGDLHAGWFHRAWGTAEFAELLRKKGVWALIAKHGRRSGARRPVGFALYRQAAREGEILSIAVDPKFRRKAIGRRLMEAVIRKLYAERIDRVYLEVDAENRAATALYRKLGFRTVGERQGYCSGPHQSDGKALVMRHDLR